MGRFCVAPWVGISTDVNGSLRPCCRYVQPGKIAVPDETSYLPGIVYVSNQPDHPMPWMKDGTINDLYNGPEFKKLRQAFLDGKEPVECKICWDEEKTGIHSFRQRYSSSQFDWSNEKFDLETRAVPKLLDFKLSNVCNLKCRMCGGQASSSIAKEEGNLNPYHLSDKIFGTDNEKEFFEETLPTIKYLELTGGEPFFSPENKKLIEKIAETEYAKNIWLKITTNGMFYVPRLLDKMQKSFSYGDGDDGCVDIAVSLDDIGPRIEYARGNSDWKKISNNIKLMKYNYPDFKIQIYRTVNIFNIYYLDELDTWAEENDITVASGVLHTPSHLNIQHLPRYIKDDVVEKLGHVEKYKHIMDFMNDHKPNGLETFREHTQRLDKIRNESFEEAYPEWAEMLLW